MHHRERVKGFFFSFGSKSDSSTIENQKGIYIIFKGDHFSPVKSRWSLSGRWSRGLSCYGEFLPLPSRPLVLAMYVGLGAGAMVGTKDKDILLRPRPLCTEVK